MPAERGVADGGGVVNIVARSRLLSAACAFAAAVIIAVAALGCSTEQPTTVAELIDLSPEEHRSILLDGMLAGRLLYVKKEQFQSVASGGLPPQFVTETWFGVGSDGEFNSAVSTLWLEDGPETTDMLLVYRGQSIEDWLAYAWRTADYAERSGAEFKGRGKLHQWNSVIYEWQTDSGVQRLEIVESAPLIARESAYDVDEQGELSLTESNTVLEYRLLPAGSAPPPVRLSEP